MLFCRRKVPDRALEFVHLDRLAIQFHRVGFIYRDDGVLQLGRRFRRCFRFR